MYRKLGTALGLLAAVVGLALAMANAAPVSRVLASDAAAPNACEAKKEWQAKGNCATNPNKHYVGTRDNQPLVFRTNKIEGMRLATNGNLGIGTANPVAKLHLANAEEAIRMQGTTSGQANVTYMSWQDGSGTALGYVGDGSTTDSDTYLTSYVGDVHVYTAAGSVLMAGADGQVSIGTTAPAVSSKLTIRHDGNPNAYGVRVESPNGDLMFGVRNGGSVYIASPTADSTTHACLRSTVSTATVYFANCSSAAEYVPTVDDGEGYPEAADLVSIAPAVKNPYGDTHGPFVVQKADTACDSNLLGFIVKPESGGDGVNLNEHYLPLAIYGYFPAKVTMENGTIRRGDPITSSAKAGYGMKATGACKVIGYALEDASAEGTIQVFADSGESTVSEVANLRGQVDALRQTNLGLTRENDSLQAQLTAIERRLAALEQTAPVTVRQAR